MSKLDKTLTTRGVECASNSSSKVSKALFKPLIATSLALALGVSAGHAQPVIDYTIGGVQQNTNLTSPQGWSWNTGTGQNPYDNFWMPVISGGTNNKIESLTFQFDTTQTDNASQTVNGNNLTINVDGRVKSNQNTILSLTSSDKGLVLNNGVGILTFNFSPSTNQNDWNPLNTTNYRKMILDLSGVSTYDDKQVSLLGNILIQAGRAQGWLGENKFEATFGGDVIGDITVQNSSGYNDISTTMTFSNNASLQGDLSFSATNSNNTNIITGIGGITGNITLSGGTNSITFAGDTPTVTGDITLSGGNTTFTGLTTFEGTIQANSSSGTINFQGTATKLNKNNDKIVNTANSSKAILNFQANTTEIIGNIYVTSNNGYYQVAKNTLTFSSNTSTITGNIMSYVNITGVSTARNEIIFQGSENKIIGKIFTNGLLSQDGQENNIVNFSNTTAYNTIQGSVVAEDDGYGASAKNKVTLSGTHNIIQKTDGATDVIISKGGAGNVIIFNGQAATENTITGNIHSYSGSYNRPNSVASNNVTFSGSSQQNTIDGEIKAIRDNYGTGKNTITFENNQVGGQNLIKKAITARGGTNEISFSGIANSSIAQGIVAEGSSYGGNGVNIITFNSEGENLIDGSITATPYGSYSATNTITFTAGTTNTITGDISNASGGTNDISFKAAPAGEKVTRASGVSGSFTGSIDNNAGRTTIVADDTLSINTSSVATSKSIVARGGGNATNTITATTLNISNTSLSVTDNASNKNVLTATNGTISLVSVSANNGQNTLSKTENSYFSDADAITGKLSITKGVSSSGTGGNNISFKANSAQTSTLIGANTNGDALLNAGSGINNVYLNASEAVGLTDATTLLTAYIADNNYNLKDKSIIAGNINNTGRGTTNIEIVGTQNASQIGILGNISNSGNGNINVIFKDAIFAPNQMIVKENSYSIGTNQTGTITNSGGGNITIVTNFSTVSPTPSGVSIYNINNTNGVTNVAIQGGVTLGANINYGSSGEVNLLFANVISGTTAVDGATDIQNGQIFGAIYQDGIRLKLKDKAIATITDEGEQQISFLTLAGASDMDNSTFSFETNRTTGDDGSGTDTVTLRGIAIGEIVALQDSAEANYRYNITLDEKAIYMGGISLSQNTQAVDLTMKVGSKLFTDNEKFIITNLAIENTQLDRDNLLKNSFVQNSTVIDLATDGNDFGNLVKRENFRALVIGGIPTDESQTKSVSGLTGNGALFRVYVNPNVANGTLGGVEMNNSTSYAYSDRILITAGSAGNHYLQAIYDSNTDISKITYQGGGTETEGNIAVATIKKDTKITFEGAKQIQGFDLVGTTLSDKISTASDGTYSQDGGYETYFIKSVTSTGASEANAKTTAVALGLNYELFLANFNSLNKRMGELRNNDNAQGAWGRVFNGMLSTSYGLESKSIYTTIQAGYDYAFGFEGANNYLGFALSYANSISDSKKMLDYDGLNKGIESAISHGIELALYNSYVQDDGWFNDTVFKFSYIMSDLDIATQNSNYSVNNYGIVFSDEFGYRFKLGDDQEWYIDPQVEVGFGYYSQSDLKQVLGEASLDGTQSAIMTIRGRVGANWAYDFKKFTQDKDISASVYIGTYYSYDYISGGEISMTTNLGVTTGLTPLASTGKFELNVGTNIQVQNNTRIYFDFERSFGGDITTEYQVNLGVRYSFGENTGYTPVDPNKKSITPLKVSDENASEEEVENTQESTENTSSESTSEATTEQNTNPTENTTEEKAQ